MTDQDLKRHPIRGGIWGIPTGLGLGLLAINSQVFSLSIATLAGFAVLGVAIGAVWASFGPAKKPKGAPPASAEPTPAPISSTPAWPAPESEATESTDAANDPGPTPTQF